MVTIKNEFLTASFSEVGAELKSLVCSGFEYIWPGKSDIWEKSSPILFPICGRLKDDKFVFNNKEYVLQKHGYALFTTFEVEFLGEDKVVFLHRSNEETKAQYPFDYELRVVYALEGKSLQVNYIVKNKSATPMYFSIGAHEGYNTPEGIEEYDVIFPQNETLNHFECDDSLLTNKTEPIIKDQNVLALDEKYFVIDALIFKELKSRSATLRNRKTGRAIRVDFPNDNYFLLWHKHKAPYICLEPWSGIPDSIDSGNDITQKEGIIPVDIGGEYVHSHTVTIL